MHTEDKTLELLKSYEFDVMVGESNNWFAGKLTLSPTKIIFRVAGEECGKRVYKDKWRNKEIQICKDINRTFVLFGLRVIAGQQRALGYHPDGISFFESTYSVEHVICFPFDIYDDFSITGIRIHSSTIADWIGNTNTQERINSKYLAGLTKAFDTEELFEFSVNILDKISLGIYYNVSMYWSPHEYRSGLTFPPSLIVDFKEKLDSRNIKNQFDKVYTLFHFLVGSSLVVEKIGLVPNRGGSSKASMYYTSDKKDVDAIDPSKPILFPLGKDIRFDQSGLPALPLGLFENFYSFDDTEYGYFAKYVRYKSMSNPEDRFLGFFRLLEKLTFKAKEFVDGEKLHQLISRAKPYLYKKLGEKKSVDSFLKGLARYNRSKYNTEKCIQDFFLSIPETMTSDWQFKRSDIGSICKLRNDIVHANDYYVSDADLIDRMYFIEILLIFALSRKIGFSTEFCAKFVTRFDGYRNVRNRHNKSLQPTA